MKKKRKIEKESSILNIILLQMSGKLLAWRWTVRDRFPMLQTAALLAKEKFEMLQFPFDIKTNEIPMVDESMHCNWSKFHTRYSTCEFGTSLGEEESAMDIA